MKKIKDFILALMMAGTVSACTEQNTIPEPVIGEISVSDVTVYSARISGSVTVPNTTDLLEFGIELSTDYQFDPLKTRKTEAEAEEFSIAVKDLEADRRYYARTYYIDHNSSGNIYRYSKPVDFLTPSLETLIRTDNASDVDKTKATLNGYVNTTGCITEGNPEFGFYIGTSSTTINRSVQYTDFDTEDKGCHFWAEEDQLTENTRYYYQAYVTLGRTTYKGEIKEFLTSDIQAKVTTGEADAITQTGAKLSGSLASNKYGQSYWFRYSDKYEELEELKTSGTRIEASGNDSGFSVTISDLKASTPYFYVACVRVEGIDFYGDVQSFTTEKEVTPTPPTPSKGWPGWFELPAVSDADGNRIDDKDNTLYYARHSFKMSSRELRNYTVCYSSEHHCPVWVAAPRHSVYQQKGTSRSDAYKADPDIPSNIQYNSKSTGGDCNKGHMLGSAERLCCAECNRQVFYYSNIAPQLNDGFNTGGGGWNILEDWVDGQVCSDTLYVVIGCYFDEYTDGYGKTVHPKTISFGDRNDVSFPTMFYYILLRTKNGKSGRPVSQCSATELKCAAFVRSHTTAHRGQKPSSREMMSVSDLEKVTGFTYFPNVPNAPKTVCNPSDWGL